MSDANPGTAAAPEGLPVAMRTLGCKVNRVESDDIAADLLGDGVRIVAEDEAAVVIINTCTVTGEADAKARKAVRQALAASGEPVVVVTGCLASLDAAALHALGDRVVVEADKEQVAGRVRDLLGIAKGPGSAAVATDTGVFRTRVQVKIQDGCDCFCTYCIVPHARGLPRSVAHADVVRRVSGLVGAGVSEVVLTGVNLGRYSSDGDLNLAGLVRAVADTGIPRLRLSSIEPLDLTPGLLGVLADTPAVCEHLHVPMQSGSDAVLSAMGRGYSVAEFEARIAAARQSVPGLVVTTDVIAGFPGETDGQALETLATVERLGFSRLHVFRYSERRGTPAAEMAGSIAPTVRAARAAALRELDAKLRERHERSAVGQMREVLVETAADGYATGTTRDYLRVRVPATQDTGPGSLLRVRIAGAEGGVLLGEV